MSALTGKFLFLLLGGLWLSPATTRANEPDPDDWNRHWKDCHNLRLPIFQLGAGEVKTLLNSGMVWESKVKKELIEITEVTEVTCKRWAENPNGEGALEEFIRKFSAVSGSALILKQQANDELLPKLLGWMKTEAAELAPLGFHFEEFACGQAFLRSHQRVRAHLQSIEQKFQTLKAKCPAAADAEIAKAVKAGLLPSKAVIGIGAPAARAPAGESKNGKSDITGTKPVPIDGGKK